MKLNKLICSIICISVLIFSSCVYKNENKNYYYSIGVVSDRFLNDITLLDIKGGASGYQASLLGADNFIKNMDMEETIPEIDNLEVVAIYDENENIKLCFAYSYTSGKVYICKNNITYTVNNPEELQLWLGNILCQNDYYYTDLKLFWINDKDYSHFDLGNDNWYVDNFSFRYNRYFGLVNSDTDDIFYSIDGYSNQINDKQEMLIELAKAMQCKTYNAILAYDDITGYWRVELYGDNTKALVYLDNTFKIMWGINHSNLKVDCYHISRVDKHPKI